ncbi:MAG: DUF3108 domain-containing protein [Pseudaminobacter sp.]|nr:DUF3108 domain-containing protein [Pseudaminobacter sp.]
MAVIIQALLVALVVTVPAPRKEGLQSFGGDYSVSFLGIPVASSTFNSTFEGDSFSVKGVLSAAGLAQLFDDTQGSMSSAGRFAGDTTQPTAFRVDYTEGKKSKMTSIRFKGGAVTKAENVPPLKKRGRDWVPVRKSHLQTVTDPLSATLVRADSLAEVCGRTIRIFDGEFRADLTLSPESSGPMSVQGFEGETVTCRVGFAPVAGYRKGRKALDYLKNHSEIRIAFAPLGTTGVYALIRATVGTQIGTVTIQAQRFEATK